MVTLLDRAVAGGRVVKDRLGEVYTGFATYGELAVSRCDFVPMNSNRAINKDVVRQRVNENKEAFLQTGRYLDFGQINLIVISQDPSHEFLVMDGQHRCETMRELHRQYPEDPDREIWFQFRVKVVGSEPLAFKELEHFQRAYPTDPRSFFHSRAAARAATAVLEKLKSKFGRAFKQLRLSNGRGRGTVDPDRPFLNDNLVFWLLKDSGLCGGDECAANADATLAALEDMNRLMAGLAKSELGEGVTDKMMRGAQGLRCHLGFFREGKLSWHDLQFHLHVAAPAASEVASPTRSAEQRSNSECVVCLDRPSVVAFLPCGHTCTCETCARAIQGAPGNVPTCPVCRLQVEGTQRIYL